MFAHYVEHSRPLCFILSAEPNLGCGHVDIAHHICSLHANPKKEDALSGSVSGVVKLAGGMKISHFFKQLTLIVILVFVNSLRRANARFRQWLPFVTGWPDRVGRSQSDRQWVAMIGCFQTG
jgi:hypothetical protein